MNITDTNNSNRYRIITDINNSKWYLFLRLPRIFSLKMLRDFRVVSVSRSIKQSENLSVNDIYLYETSVRDIYLLQLYKRGYIHLEAINLFTAAISKVHIAQSISISLPLNTDDYLYEKRSSFFLIIFFSSNEMNSPWAEENHSSDAFTLNDSSA